MKKKNLSILIEREWKGRSYYFDSGTHYTLVIPVSYSTKETLESTGLNDCTYYATLIRYGKST